MNSPDGATPDLPSDIVAQIFLRLPVKSLCRFKCASKPWRSLISNPNFAKKHFHHNKTTKNQPAERLFSISGSLKCQSLDMSSKPQVTDLIFLNRKMPIRFHKIWESCGGILLLSDSESSMFLVNPSTGECKKLPPCPFFIDSDPNVDSFGFGYDISADDYKVVRISLKENYSQFDEDVVGVYNLTTNSWRRIESGSYSFFLNSSFRNGTFINGSVHWIGKDNIISLDLASEKFQNMPFPSAAYEVSLLYAMDGYLCGFDFSSWEDIDVWVMSVYGVHDSWVKFTFSYPSMDSFRPLRTGKLLIVTRRKLVIYDLRVGKVRQLTVGSPCADFISYEESLIRLQEQD